MMAAFHQKLVLLLAGDELTRCLTTSCLEMSGYDVLSARSAGEVEAMLLDQGARRVDILVTDADVRDTVDGLSLATVARCLDPDVAVIYTARAPHMIPEAGTVAGAPRLRTPYHAHQLLGLIEGLALREVDRFGAARAAA